MLLHWGIVFFKLPTTPMTPTTLQESAPGLVPAHRRVKPPRSKKRKYHPKKVRIKIRLTDDMAAFFRSMGRERHKFLNDALRAYIERFKAQRHPRRPKHTRRRSSLESRLW